MLSLEKVILVTGANRGIGLSILKSLMQCTETGPYILLMGCRNIATGNMALEDVRANNQETKIVIDLVELDVTSDASIRNAVTAVTARYGRLDVLVNNAGIAILPSASDLSDHRNAFNMTYDVNVSSVYLVTSLFLPLLRQSNAGKVVNISSARGSLTRSAQGKLPPTASIAYSITKTALNSLTLEMSRLKENEHVEFQAASPGHCRTEFNGHRGTRDPMEGANVVVELITSMKRRKTASWETIGSDRNLKEVPW